jgi:hypothetical protein
MASEKQIQANRRNSLRSTGPRTEAGKSRSCLNALRPGAHSKSFLTPDEQDADLGRLESMYLAHYRPRSEFEKDQVQTLAASDWRLRRCRRMEAEIIELYGFEDEDQHGSGKLQYAGAGWGFTHDSSKSKSLLALSRFEGGIFREFLAFKKQLDAQLARPTPAGEPAAAG